MVLIKNLKIFHLLFLAKCERKMSLTRFQKGKKLFQTIKKRKLKSQKLGFVQRGQSMVLVKSLKIFHLFIFGKIREENFFDHILEMKKAFLDYKKKEVKKVKNWDLSKGGQSIVLVKSLKIFHLFIFGKIREESVFDDILERKKAFLDYKKEKLKKVKHGDFSKGVSPSFWSKL